MCIVGGYRGRLSGCDWERARTRAESNGFNGLGAVRAAALGCGRLEEKKQMISRGTDDAKPGRGSSPGIEARCSTATQLRNVGDATTPSQSCIALLLLAIQRLYVCTHSKDCWSPMSSHVIICMHGRTGAVTSNAITGCSWAAPSRILLLNLLLNVMI